MTIINSVPADIDAIFALYEAGTALQKTLSKKHWKGFQRTLVEQEIAEYRQWKIMEGNQMACCFAVAFSDPFIWQEKSKDPAIYIHRIATHPGFRGNGYVKNIVEWARAFASQNGLKYIRMDTGSGNERLNNYYIACGFTYLGISSYPITENLPEHYKAGSSSLFEISL